MAKVTIVKFGDDGEKTKAVDIGPYDYIEVEAGGQTYTISMFRAAAGLLRIRTGGEVLVALPFERDTLDIGTLEGNPG